MAEDNTALAKRLKTAQQLFRMFQPERLVHLILNVVCFLLLVWAAVLLLRSPNLDMQALLLILGSGGLAGVTSSRMLRMWSDVLRVVFQTPQPTERD